MNRSIQPVAGSHEPNALDIDVVQRRLAELEGADAAVVLASGMAATACTMLALLRTGDHLIVSTWLYGPARRLFERELPALGIAVTFIDPTKLRSWRRAVRPNTRALFVESPVNPTTRLVDLRHVRRLTLECGIALVVDSTFATPINCRPVEFGADVVVHSAAEYLNGAGLGDAGVVCASDALVDEVREKMAVWGALPDAMAIERLARGLPTLELRVQQQNASALRIAQWAEQHPAIGRVLHPGLPSHPDHAIAREILSGFGATIAISLVNGERAAEHTMQRLSRFRDSASVGGVSSLIRRPRQTSHRLTSRDTKADPYLTDDMLQLHIGLEATDELVADLTFALAS